MPDSEGINDTMQRTGARNTLEREGEIVQCANSAEEKVIVVPSGILQCSGCECERRRSVCFLLVVTEPLHNSCGGVRPVSAQQGKKDKLMPSACFGYLKVSPMLVCVCARARVFVPMWFCRERVHNAAPRFQADR